MTTLRKGASPDLLQFLRDLFPRHHAVAADKNFIPINTHKSRYSKSAEGI